MINVYAHTLKTLRRIREPAILSGRLGFYATTSPRMWATTDPMTYEDDEYGRITARAGLMIDGVSIPRIAWTLAGPPLADAETAGPAVIHDLLYYLADRTRFTRKDADIIFARALFAEGVWWPKVWVYYIAVRLGGWIGWRRAKRETEFQARAKEWLIDG